VIIMTQDIVNEILNKPNKLSKDQEEAVLSDARYTRIIAGAGAGKTETLTRRIAYLILVKNVEPSSIVAFTFTERAAQSMKSRIYQRVKDLDNNKLGSLGEMYIGTIHAYAKRILDDLFNFGIYTVLDENKEIAFLMRHGWDIGINEYERNYSEACRTFLRTVNMVYGEMLDRRKLEQNAPDFYEKLMHYEYLLEENRLLTFGRMIYLAVQKLMEKPGAVNINYLIVDEYQDINRAQEELIRLIGKNGSIFVVGDPRQCIYQWRGSNERFFLNFSNIFEGAKTINIKENRRSGKRIVMNANRFAETFQNASYEPMVATREDDGFIGLIEHETIEDEACWIADQIQYLVNERGLRYNDIGILTRSVRYSADSLVDVLKERRIPYIVGGKIGLFKRDEAQALGRIFAWLSNNGFWLDDSNWDGRVTGDDLLYTALDYWRSVYRYNIDSNLEDRLREIRNRVLTTNSYNNLTEIFQDILIVLGFKNLNHNDPYDAAIMANLGRFNVLLTDYETANRIGGRKPNWEVDLKGLCWFINNYASWAYEEQPIDDIRGIDAVQIMTVHQAKGLEWPIVFIFSMNNKRFPSSMIGRELNWCGIPRNLFDARRYEGNLDDERRLFYVALTRAKDALIISYYKKQNKRGVKRSTFIDDLDLRLVTQLNKGYMPTFPISQAEIVDSMITFSASEITSFLVCPYMYLLKNVYGYQPGLTEALGYGKGIHHCLKRAVELLKNDNELGPITAVAKAIDEEFFMPFVSGDEFEDFKRSARKCLINYAKSNGNDLRESSDVEYRIEFPVHNATIAGRVDVLRGEEIRDYKTAEYDNNSYMNQEIDTQIRVYVMGLKSMGRVVNKASVAFLNSKGTEIKYVDISEPYIKGTMQDVENGINRIRAKKFTANSGEHCNNCNVKSICRWRVY